MTSCVARVSPWLQTWMRCTNPLQARKSVTRGGSLGSCEPPFQNEPPLSERTPPPKKWDIISEIRSVSLAQERLSALAMMHIHYDTDMDRLVARGAVMPSPIAQKNPTYI